MLKSALATTLLVATMILLGPGTATAEMVAAPPNTSKPSSPRFIAPKKAKFQYVGWKRCALCHKGKKSGYIVESWKKTQHAKAFESLQGAERENPACLKCHVTGKKRQYGPGVMAKALRGVQCEACHGPGSEYRKSRDRMEDRETALSMGLVLPDEQTCLGCHNEECPNYRTFNFRMMFPKIEHRIPRSN